MHTHLRAGRIALVLILLCSSSSLAAEDVTQATEPVASARIPLLSPHTLLERLRSGEAIVFVDVREPEEYAEGHLPGAINIPERDFAARQGEIDRNATVIPYCNMDFRGFVAVRSLQALGFAKVALMQERGIEGWRKQGLPIAGPETGASDAESLAKLRSLPLDELQGDRFAKPVEPSGVVHRVSMEAAQWYFHPNDLKVNAGDELRIQLTSKQGSHFFILPEFEVGEAISEGETKEIRFVADRAGDFRFGSCEWDGSDLQVMKGRLRVLEPSE